MMVSMSVEEEVTGEALAVAAAPEESLLSTAVGDR